MGRCNSPNHPTGKGQHGCHAFVGFRLRAFAVNELRFFQGIRNLGACHIETGGQSRHSGESRNPEKSTTWTPAFAGVTVQLIHAFHRD